VKIALHADQLYVDAPGGIGTYVRELLDAFAEMSAPDDEPRRKLDSEMDPENVPKTADAPEITAFTVARARGSGAPAAHHRIDTVTVPGSIRWLYPAWNLLGRPALPPALDRCRALHATNHAAVPPAGAGQGLVVTVHDLAFDHFPDAFPPTWRWLYRAGVRAAIQRADVLIVPSATTAVDLVARGADAGAVRITPLASSLPHTPTDVDEVLQRLGIPRPYVVCAATLEPRKNQTRLVRAYRQVAVEVPHALVLAGPAGWRVGELETELGRAGAGSVVRTGRLDAPDLDAVIRGADAMVYPSLYEGFGLPVIEAMARGVPVVASNTPAVAETAGDAAVLVDPRDVAGLADTLARVLTDDSLRGDLSDRGRDRAGAFSWPRTARATLDAYREAASRAEDRR
jgi:glycosyltransferase involved in cell wall biosynthesis